MLQGTARYDDDALLIQIDNPLDQRIFGHTAAEQARLAGSQGAIRIKAGYIKGSPSHFNRIAVDDGILFRVAIAANKVPGIRAALCHDTFSAQASREHNDANILTLGERVIGPGLARDIVAVWLQAEFSGGRHGKRVDKITAIENKYNCQR